MQSRESKQQADFHLPGCFFFVYLSAEVCFWLFFLLLLVWNPFSNISFLFYFRRRSQVIQLHFFLKKDQIIEELEQWVAEATALVSKKQLRLYGASHVEKAKSHLSQLKAELAKLAEIYGKKESQSAEEISEQVDCSQQAEPLPEADCPQSSELPSTQDPTSEATDVTETADSLAITQSTAEWNSMTETNSMTQADSILEAESLTEDLSISEAGLNTADTAQTTDLLQDQTTDLLQDQTTDLLQDQTTDLLQDQAWPGLWDVLHLTVFALHSPILFSFLFFFFFVFWSARLPCLSGPCQCFQVDRWVVAFFFFFWHSPA